MPTKIPIDEEAVRGWMEVAHGSRTLQHCLRHAGDPQAGSQFTSWAFTDRAKQSGLVPFDGQRRRLLR